MTPAVTFAAESPNLLPVPAQLGIASFFIALFLWFGWQAYKRERDRADRLEADLATINKKLVEDVVPMMSQATKVIERAYDSPVPARRATR